MYRVTEGLQREKQSLMKQLDLLRYDDILGEGHMGSRLGRHLLEMAILLPLRKNNNYDCNNKLVIYFV